MTTLPRQTLTVKRVNAATVYIKGRAQAEATSNITISTSVQPLGPNEMELLPEGRRDSEAFRLYHKIELFPADEVTKKNADVVVYNGKDYEVVSCARWQNRVIPHFKTVMVKV